MKRVGQRRLLDADGYLEAIENPGGDAYSFDYHPSGSGLMKTMTDPELYGTTYGYDELGGIIALTYDDNGNLTSIMPPGRPAHGFDYAPMNLESKYNPPMPEPTPQPAIADPATYYAYDDDGQMTHVTRPDGAVIETYLRNDFGEVTDYTAAVSGTPVLETTYGRDGGMMSRGKGVPPTLLEMGFTGQVQNSSMAVRLPKDVTVPLRRLRTLFDRSPRSALPPHR